MPTQYEYDKAVMRIADLERQLAAETAILGKWIAKHAILEHDLAEARAEIERLQTLYSRTVRHNEELLAIIAAHHRETKPEPSLLEVAMHIMGEDNPETAVHDAAALIAAVRAREKEQADAE